MTWGYVASSAAFAASFIVVGVFVSWLTNPRRRAR